MLVDTTIVNSLPPRQCSSLAAFAYVAFIHGLQHVSSTTLNVNGRSMIATRRRRYQDNPEDNRNSDALWLC